MLRKNSFCHFSVSTEELLGDHNFNTEDSKTVKVELEKYFNSTKKRNLKLLLLLLCHNKKKIFIDKKALCTYQGLKKTFLLLYLHVKDFIVHIIYFER